MIVAYGHNEEDEEPTPIKGRVEGRTVHFDEEVRFRYIQVARQAQDLILETGVREIVLHVPTFGH